MRRRTLWIMTGVVSVLLGACCAWLALSGPPRERKPFPPDARTSRAGEPVAGGGGRAGKMESGGRWSRAGGGASPREDGLPLGRSLFLAMDLSPGSSV